MLEIFLSLNGRDRGIEDLKIDETFDVEALGMPWHYLVSMFVNPTDEMTCDPDVECTARATGKELAAIMHDVAHFSALLSERALAVRPAGSV